MVTEVKYIIWGIAMLIHALYINTTHLVSFGWDTIELNGLKLYMVVIPYSLFSLWMIFYSLVRLKKG